jgi:hypothetical protein
MQLSMAFVTTIEDDAGNELAELYTAHDKYLLPDATPCFVSTNEAWCRRCEAFVLIEKLTNPEEMEKSAREFYQDGIKHPVGVSLREIMTKINEELLAKGLHDAAQWRLVLSTRVSPPRCLECGESDYVLIPEEAGWIAYPESAKRRIRIKSSIDHASMADSTISKVDELRAEMHRRKPSRKGSTVKPSPTKLPRLAALKRRLRGGESESNRKAEANAMRLIGRSRI